MRHRSSVPALAAWLVGISVPPQDRATLLGDLEERFHRRCSDRGAREARGWYRKQALRIGVALGPRRVLRSLVRLAAPGTFRAAVRSLLRSPGASVASAVTLAVGIAAPVAMFALADGVTANLPGDEADRVVRVSWTDDEGQAHVRFPEAVVEAWRRSSVGPGRVLGELAAFRSEGRVAVAGGGTAARRERGVYATAALFRLVEVTPVAGRLYSDDEQAGRPAVVIREDLRDERFGRGVDALGRGVGVEGVEHVVVGVVPASFGFPVNDRLWMRPPETDATVWSVVGRLAPGVTAGQAREELARVMADVGAEPADVRAIDLRVDPYTEAHFSDGQEPENTRRVGMLSLLLVVLTAANVAAVMVARGVSRSGETAVRMALGARRSQVMALTLAEGLILAVAGGLLGLALARAALSAMVRYLSGQATVVPYWLDFSPGPRSFVVAGLLTLLALLVAALAPALHASRGEPGHVLRLRPHGGPGGGARLMRRVVGVEVALSCFLLAVSSVVVEGALAQLRTGTEFTTEGLTTGQFELTGPAYGDVDARRAFLSELRHVLRTEPSLAGASLASHLPGREGAVLPVGLSGREEEPNGLLPAQVRSVDPGFFPLLDVPASAGRLFSDADDAAGQPVALVNPAFVRRHGLESGALERRIAVAGLFPDEVYEPVVVGVVEDRGVTPTGLERPAPGVYLPLAQITTATNWLTVRTRDGAPVFDVWHRTAGSLDPNLPLGDVLSLDEALRRGQGAATFFMSVFLVLGGVTLLVALVGLHGVHAFTLAHRARDIGVRRALGAGRGQVLREGLRRGLRPVWLGLLVGIVPGVLTARAVVPIESDVKGWLLVPPLLLLTSVVAVWRPTRKASAADPMEVLRET